MPSCSNTICFKDFPFSGEFPLLLCQQSGDSVCVDLFLGSLGCSSDVYAWCVAGSQARDHCSFIGRFEVVLSTLLTVPLQCHVAVSGLSTCTWDSVCQYLQSSLLGVWLGLDWIGKPCWEFATYQSSQHVNTEHLSVTLDLWFIRVL